MEELKNKMTTTEDIVKGLKEKEYVDIINERLKPPSKDKE